MACILHHALLTVVDSHTLSPLLATLRWPLLHTHTQAFRHFFVYLSRRPFYSIVHSPSKPLYRLGSCTSFFLPAFAQKLPSSHSLCSLFCILLLAPFLHAFLLALYSIMYLSRMNYRAFTFSTRFYNLCLHVFLLSLSPCFSTLVLHSLILYLLFTTSDLIHTVVSSKAHTTSGISGVCVFTLKKSRFSAGLVAHTKLLPSPQSGKTTLSRSLHTGDAGTDTEEREKRRKGR